MHVHTNYIGILTGTPVSWKFKNKRKIKEILDLSCPCVSLLIECDFWVNRVIFRIFRCLRKLLKITRSTHKSHSVNKDEQGAR